MATRPEDLCIHIEDHVPYPHQAGSLFDCPGCEAHCHCHENHDESCTHPMDGRLYHTTPCVWSGHDLEAVVSKRVAQSFAREAEYLPAADDHERPALRVAGALVFAYVDETGLRVAIDLDEVDRALRVGPDETTPVTVTIQGRTVFHSPSDSR